MWSFKDLFKSQNLENKGVSLILIIKIILRLKEIGDAIPWELYFCLEILKTIFSNNFKTKVAKTEKSLKKYK